jgi:hypothetical protein
VADDAAVTAMARRIVAQVAPEEMEFFDETVEVLPLADAGRAARRRGDDPLAFGVVESAAVVVTGIACGAAHEVVKAMAEDLGAGLAGRLRRLGRRPAGPPAVLPEERVTELREVAQRTAVLLGLPADRAELLGQAVADHLRQPADTGDSGDGGPRG